MEIEIQRKTLRTEKRNRTLCALPCYNESYNLPNLFKDLASEEITNDADLLFIDDASTDNSVEILKSQGVELICHPTNYGYGQAVKTAFEYAIQHDYDSLIIFPGDGQRSAKDLKTLIKTYQTSDFDVITGSKFHIYSDKYGPINRRLGNIIYSNIAHLGWESPIEDVLSGFKIYNVKAVQPFFHILPKGYPFDICFSFYASRFGLKIKEIPVNCRYDDHTSKMNSVIWVSIKMLTKLIYHLIFHRLICPLPDRKSTPVKTPLQETDSIASKNHVSNV